jgi:hypothetical protein
MLKDLMKKINNSYEMTWNFRRTMVTTKMSQLERKGIVPEMEHSFDTMVASLQDGA